eukprot:1241813-Prymnesium_polylepis.1
MSSLLSRCPLGMRRWAVEGPPAIACFDRHGLPLDVAGQGEHDLSTPTKEAARAVKSVQSLRDAWRASVLMKLLPGSGAARSLRRPHGDDCCGLLRPPGGMPRTVWCTRVIQHDPLGDQGRVSWRNGEARPDDRVDGDRLTRGGLGEAAGARGACRS